MPDQEDSGSNFELCINFELYGHCFSMQTSINVRDLAEKTVSIVV